MIEDALLWPRSSCCEHVAICRPLQMWQERLIPDVPQEYGNGKTLVYPARFEAVTHPRGFCSE